MEVNVVSAATVSRNAPKIGQSALKMAEPLAAFGVFGMIGMSLLTVGDIVSRQFFSVTFVGLNEITGLTVALAVAMCLPAGILKRSPLTIELLLGNLKGAPRAWLAAIGTAGMLAFLAILAWQFWLVSSAAYVKNETTIISSLPTAPFLYGISVCFTLCMVAQLIVFIEDCEVVLKSSGIWGILAVAALVVSLAAIAAVTTGAISGAGIAALFPRNNIALAGVVFILMWIITILSVPLGAAMGLSGLIGAGLMISRSAGLAVLGSEVKHYLTDPSLAVLPFFLLMGMFASIAGLGSDLYRLATAFLGHRRGGLANATIAGCAAFGSLTGSSMATQLTLGHIAMPEMEKRGYSQALSAGTMAAGGTLGQLIPPSTAMILYCVIAEQSVGRMFMGAVLPGILAGLLYMATVTIWVMVKPDAAPRSGAFDRNELIASLKSCWAAVLLLGLVLGGIYTGMFTELEAGSFGVVGAALLSIARRKLTLQSMWGMMSNATSTIGIMYTLLFGVSVLSFMFGISGLPDFFLRLIDTLSLTPLEAVIMLIVFYLVLGTAMDSWTIMVITVPIFAPVVAGLGYDPIWWGIMVIMCMEAGQISPPFGLNIFIMKSISPQIPLKEVYKGCTAFFLSTVVKIALLVLFPAIVTWLPGTM